MERQARWRMKEECGVGVVGVDVLGVGGRLDDGEDTAASSLNRSSPLHALASQSMIDPSPAPEMRYL